MQKMSAAGSMLDSIRRIVRAAGCASVMLACSQCSQLGPSCDTGDTSNPPDPYEKGTVQGGVYMSSPWTGPLLPFPGGKRYDLVHNLGCTPSSVVLWESFSEEGTAAGSIAPCAGNMCVVQIIDNKVIRIKNDSCSDYFVLATALGCETTVVDAGSDSASDAP